MKEDQVGFSPVKRRGYEMREVDDLLDRIAGRPTGRALENALDPIPESREMPSEHSTSAVVQEQAGFLATLLGRRR